MRDCSDAIIEEEHQEKAPWRERKEAYISKVRSKPVETILVSCADKLHNARSIMFVYDKIGDAICDRFKPTKEEILWYFESLVTAFEEAWPENPLLPDFSSLAISEGAYLAMKKRHTLTVQTINAFYLTRLVFT